MSNIGTDEKTDNPFFEGNFIDILIPSNVLGKYNVNRF